MTSEKTIQAWLKTAGTLPLLEAKLPDARLSLRLRCSGELICVHQYYIALAIRRAIDEQPVATYDYPPMPVEWEIDAAEWALGWRQEIR